SKEENEGWILNVPQFHCDAECRDKLDAPGLDKAGCLNKDILSPSDEQRFRLGMCLREKNGLKELTTTKLYGNDHRFTCRPSKDRMTWYRGRQSLTFNGKQCIRWDEAPVKFPLRSFSSFSSPSVDYTTLKVFATSLSQHENHCRNPDNHRFGPWCFYQDGNKTERAPCFHTCVTDIKKLCLAKAFFPYYQTPYLLDSGPVAPVDPHYLRNIKDEDLKRKNARYDLMDVLDVPDVVDSVGQATPLYSVALTTRHLTQARLVGNAIVTRKKCHQTGLRTLIAGPWTPIKDSSLTFPEDSADDIHKYGSQYREFQRIQFLAGRQGVDKPWKPCFTACEDNSIKCWPNQSSDSPTKRLFYFGHKVTTREQRLCLKWTEAMSALFERNAEYIRKTHAEKEKGKKKKSEPSPGLLVQLFYYEELTKRRTFNGKPGLNLFVDGGGRLLHSPICLDLARLIEQGKNSAPKNRGIYQQLLEDAYNSMYKEGPGCFTWTDDRKVYVKYVPCFNPCPCGTPSMRAPFKPYRDMCKNEKTGEYEPCIAKRESRVIHIREHDEKLVRLPETELSQLYIPLIIVVAAGVVCILLTLII
ncbi:hypothetical protein V3C99_000918, partial [Haemonchus contortus]|uniref:Kringle domain-containing protein n=1 Tax=Haemonchus contortus TaxID=6289 RepID=A0A7I4YD05_HAECO